MSACSASLLVMPGAWPLVYFLTRTMVVTPAARISAHADPHVEGGGLVDDAGKLQLRLEEHIPDNLRRVASRH